ncbi:PepSY-associated TM helix domain-containing protein [Prevotella sp.]|uniref:PepSY-associated TM helix domain-containing protein n=1 Tax=Prevotella sp. TaxID=59823 RepID=UPI0026484072|nr:PepSY-associated TM helix domain-containing protein [Prevotella sp.]MDN5553534.1 PepSY domain-containing protein [Prevotella sp.]
MKKKVFRKWHKWLGLGIAIIIVFFSITGIILNHRKALASQDINRTYLPESYNINNYNNGIVRGTLVRSAHNVIVWGNAGVWQTDSHFSFFKSMNKGLPEGADNRDILTVTMNQHRQLLAASSWALYIWKNEWIRLCDIPIRDMTIKGNMVVVVSEDSVITSLPPYNHFTYYSIKNPGKDVKVNLFSIAMKMHTGEINGSLGVYFIDFIAIVLITLTITGILFSFGKKRIKKTVLKWHNILGLWLILFTLKIVITGLCLRDPLAGLLRNVTYHTYSENIKDLRAIRWNAYAGKWMLATSQSMFWLDKLDGNVKKMNRHPKLTSMGLNVFEPIDSTKWLVGSLKGAYIYDTENEVTKNIGKNIAVVGFSKDLNRNHYILFDKRKGIIDNHGKEISKGVGEIPETLKEQGMPLWNLALEIHVGRFFTNWMKGLFSTVYVNVFGILIVIILLTGLFIHPKIIRKRK